jgi:Na+/proline symporter
MVCFTLQFHSAVAQVSPEKASLFVYDHDELDKIMDQINENTVTANSGFSLIQDSTRNEKVIDVGFFLIGSITGCATVVVLTAFWGVYSPGGKIIRLIAGGLVGFAAPTAYVKWATGDPYKARLTGIGGIAGIVGTLVTPTLVYLIGSLF